jgi:hypothetical protein
LRKIKKMMKRKWKVKIYAKGDKKKKGRICCYSFCTVPWTKQLDMARAGRMGKYNFNVIRFTGTVQIKVSRLWSSYFHRTGN